ncbi:erythromycin esterase family protein [bacterium]|nr:MAG: erythromycin esterase family protein [bacterium]
MLGNDAARRLQAKAHDLTGPSSLDALIERVGDSKVVMLGEASHGTHEYYAWRAEITLRLIREKGFDFVAVEGDWPDCYAIDRFIKGHDGNDPKAPLLRFDRWPTWMWANWEVAALAERLHRFNAEAERPVGFYGLDVYSLWESLDEVRNHLRANHPELVPAGESLYDCFHPYNREGSEYAWGLRFGLKGCADEIVDVLSALLRKRGERFENEEDHFYAEQNARVVRDAERYYRTMAGNDEKSWNVRDIHMADTLDRLLERHGPDAKGIVWEHNTHIGDARYTDMADGGMINLGQLGRERHGRKNVALIGFGSYRGSVIAGDAWGAPMERMEMPDAQEGSWETLLHGALGRNALLLSDDLRSLEDFAGWRGHRAVGVVYHPEREKYGNYVPTQLVNRYDAFLYFEETQALHPLKMTPTSATEPPETYPFGV